MMIERQTMSEGSKGGDGASSTAGGRGRVQQLEARAVNILHHQEAQLSKKKEEKINKS